MSYTTPKGGKMDKALETIQEVEYFPIRGIPERGITEETCKKLGIRTGLSNTDGTTPIAHYFPITRKGVVKGYIKVDLTKTKKQKFRFTTVGEVNVESDLLGAVNAGESGGPKLFVVEGVYDWPSVYQTLYEEQPVKGKYIPNVVSIPLGTTNALECIANNQNFCNKFKDVVLVFDNDVASEKEKKNGILKGMDAVEEVVRYYPDYLYVELERNDPNDYIAPEDSTGMKPDKKGLYKTVLYECKKYEPDDFVEGALSAAELYKPLQEGVNIQCLPKLSNILHGIRKEELTVILAPSGVGKTTAVTEMAYDILKHSEYSVDLIFAEEDVVKAQQRFISLDNNIPLNRFRENPDLVPFQDREKSRREIIGNGRTAWLDTKASFGRIDPERLLKRLKWSASKGYDFVWIDHLTMMLYRDSKVGTIDDLLVSLAEHIVSTGQGVIAVSHITRRNRPAPKDRDGNIEYPYWMEVTKEDARGAGSFEQVAWNVVCIEPEILENRERGRIRFRVDKNREHGYLGLADVVRMDSSTGRLVQAEMSYD